MKHFAQPTRTQEPNARILHCLYSMSVSLMLLITFWTADATAAISASVTASRTSGVAPLYVFFDASGTSHSDSRITPWRDLLFEYDFGDPDAGSIWTYSGMSKNRAFGSTAAHIFPKAGSYQVRVVITDTSGSKTTKTLNVTVEEPDSVFKGDLTVCVSSSGNFTGCPNGARQLHTSSSGPVLTEYTATKRRILFRRGDTFSHSGTAQIEHGQAGHIGAFPGSGNRPVFNMSSALVRFGSGASGTGSRADDWRVTDLDLRGNGSKGIYFSGTSSNILLMNLTMRGFRKGIELNRFLLDVAKGHEMFHKIAVVNCDISGVTGDKGAYNIFASGQELAFMGNVISGSVSEPVFRIQFLDRGVIQHNRISEQASTKALIKFHSCKWDESIQPCGFKYSEYVVISDNEFFGGGGGAYMLALGPQTGSSPHDERLRRITVERNYFKAGSNVQIAVMAWLGDSVVRDNIFNETDGRFWNGVEFGQRAGMPANVAGNQAYNNTCYAGEIAEKAIDCVGFSSAAFSGSVAKNNLLYAPGFDDREVVSGGVQNSGGNINAGTPSPFVVAAPKSKSDFRLARPISNGTNSLSFLGFDGVIRLDSTEVGAYSTGSVGSSPPQVEAPQPPTLLPN